MFSISPNIRRVSLPNNEQRLIEDLQKHKFDLNNENYYDANSVIVFEAPKSKYKEEFIKVLEANRYDIEELLAYHYSKSNKPELFYNYVKVDLSRNSTLDAGICDAIRVWLGNVIKAPKVEMKKKPGNSYIKEHKITNISKIEKALRVYQENDFIDENNFIKLVNALECYFENEACPPEINEIYVRDVPKKELGWVLARIHLDVKNTGFGLPYLKFANQNISIFKSVKLDERDYKKCNLYKYFTSKPKVFKASTKNTKNTF